jgi:hypothetical protein
VGEIDHIDDFDGHNLYSLFRQNLQPFVQGGPCFQLSIFSFKTFK